VPDKQTPSDLSSAFDQAPCHKIGKIFITYTPFFLLDHRYYMILRPKIKQIIANFLQSRYEFGDYAYESQNAQIHARITKRRQGGANNLFAEQVIYVTGKD